MTIDNPLPGKKVAIIHDWLYGGGAELVVEQLHKMFPDAPIYTSYCSDEWRRRLDNKVVTGWLQHLGKIRRYLPVLRIWWFTHLDLSDYDLVISSSGNGEAKGVKVPKGTLHVSYCHTPTHFYWRHYQQYIKQPGFGALNPLVRLALRILVGPLRRWDYRAAQRPDYFIANSTHIQSDIKKFYNRESVVINPPIYLDRFKELPSDTKRHGFVVVGRLVPYKHNDIIIQACNELGLPLKIVGRGPDYDRLKKLAGPTVTFDTNAPDEAVVRYMQGAKAFLFAAFEDFGVTPVEAQAAGTPLVAYKAGGALDYTTPGVTGEFFEEQTVECLKATLQTFDPSKYNHETIRESVDKFSDANFRQKMTDYLRQVVH